MKKHYLLLGTLFLTLSINTYAAKTQAIQKSSTYYERDPLSQAFINVAKQATPAVVFIKVHVGGDSDFNEFEGPADPNSPFPFGDDLFKRFFGLPPGKSTPPQPIGQGSGFFVTSDGYIMTNAHVVKNASKIEVALNDGQVVPATLVGKDVHTDIAIIKIEKINNSEFPFLRLADPDLIEVGDWVMAIGNPFGLEATVTTGIVSAKGRKNLQINTYENFIQTDAAINPGNSGGPLLNVVNGEVIGVNTAIFSKNGGYMGIGFAIPSNMAAYIMDQLIQKGSVTRGFLGVLLQPVDKEIAAAFKMAKAEGVLISTIEKGTPADKAGLEQGDIILECNGKPIQSVPEFRYELSSFPPGTEVVLKIYRKGKSFDKKIVLGAAEDIKGVNPISQKLGIEVQTLNADYAQQLGYKSTESGLVITKIKAGSLAAKAGLRPGFLIQAVNHDKVSSLEEYEAALTKRGFEKHILLLVRQGTLTKFYSLKME